MAESTWQNILNGLQEATYNSYAAKSTKQRERREVQQVMKDVRAFCMRKTLEMATGQYEVGQYRHFRLHDRKKERDISVLPYEDRCVQNDVKEAIQPLMLRQMTDDMLGGLPGCGVVANDPRHCVVSRMRVMLNNRSLKYYLQGDIRKFYDNVDKVISMQLIERKVKDRRTLAIIRQHLFNQKRLAIGDPFSHLIANLNMSVIIRKAKAKYGRRIQLINFADDFIAFSKDKKTLNALRRDMRIWAREMRLKYKPMYVRHIDGSVLDDSFKFVKENDICTIMSYKGNVFGVEVPNFVDLIVTETEPGFAGNTATNVTKPATVETGAEVKVPLFINEGDKIQIDTRTGEYLGRSKA